MLGRSVIALLILLFAGVLFLHTSYFQNRISKKLPSILSEITGAKVELENLSFSLLGCVRIEGLVIWDPEDIKVLSVQAIDARFSSWEILSGHLHLKQLKIEGIFGRLIENDKGDLNILFLSDAFAGNPNSGSTARSFQLQLDTLVLEQVDFAYNSIPNRMEVSSRLDHITSTGIEFNSKPLRVRLKDIVLSQHQLDILTESNGIPDTVEKSDAAFAFQLPNPGLDFYAEHITLKDHAFSFHKDSIRHSTRFDPDHIFLTDIDLNLAYVHVGDQGIASTLSGLSGQLPGFNLVHAGAELVWQEDEMTVRNFKAESAKSKVEADGRITSANHIPGNVHLTSTGNLALEEIVVFLPDTLRKWVGHLTDISFKANIRPEHDGSGTVDMQVNTRDSRVSLTGHLFHFLNPEQITWKDLNLQTSLGTDAKKLITEMSGEANLPPGKIEARLASKGNPDKFNLNGIVQTGWGDINLEGDVHPDGSGTGFDIQILAKNLMAGPYLDLPWLGSMNGSFHIAGASGSEQSLSFNSQLSDISIDGNTIKEITAIGSLDGDSVTTDLEIHDPIYTSNLNLRGSIGTPMRFDATLQVDSFHIGRWIHADSELLFTGHLNAELELDGKYMDVKTKGKHLTLAREEERYTLDAMEAKVVLSPDSSDVRYHADDGYFQLTANFDLKQAGELIKKFSGGDLFHPQQAQPPLSSKTIIAEGEIHQSGLFRLAGITIDSFSSVSFSGSLDEASHALSVMVDAGPANVFGSSLDTFFSTIVIQGTDIQTQVQANGLTIQSHKLGDLTFETKTVNDEIQSLLRIDSDTSKVFHLGLRSVFNEDSLAIFPEQLVFYDRAYQLDVSHPIGIRNGNIDVHDLSIILDDMRMSMDGNQDSFYLSIDNVNLTRLNPLLFADTAVIDSGMLFGQISFVRGKSLDLEAQVNQLVLLGADPLTIIMQAETRKDDIPFEFHLTNGRSKVDLDGWYAIEQSKLDATLQLDMDSLQMFRAFYQPFMEALNGAVKGEAKISGTLAEPRVNGYLEMKDVSLMTRNPKLFFHIKEDRLQFSDQGITFSDFEVYDNVDNPLYVSGTISNEGYRTLAYDLHINTDHYALINKPLSSNDALKGLLVLGADIHLQGKGRDTDISADIKISDTTNILLTLPEKQNQLLSTAGIIEFVDPDELLDTTWKTMQSSTYDSLIAGLPEINLTSSVKIEEWAELTIIIDPQSGDYFNVAGKADLDLSYDRTQNPVLNGTYDVTSGVYSLSFYDLVKKDFQLVPGSTIRWTGSPEEGELDIRAAYTFQSNSIGLVGHEVGENEQSVYKKSLPYEIGILISGTINAPEIAFTLDLPEEDKMTYPVLGSKLSRLQQPEFQSELNKQVFGLLVFGSFIPETSGAGGSSSDMATTALYNSVNSLLSAQLNRFANQYIKGVNIDVGIQSYSDYATNGGKTRTSMDFHLTKSLLNDRLVVEVGGDFDIGGDQSGANQGKSYRGDMAIIYDLTGDGDRKLKFFNNESYDIIYQEIRNTGIALIFIREFDKGELKKRKQK